MWNGFHSIEPPSIRLRATMLWASFGPTCLVLALIVLGGCRDPLATTHLGGPRAPAPSVASARATASHPRPESPQARGLLLSASGPATSVSASSGPPGSARAALVPPSSPWASSAACRASPSGRPSRAPGTARLGTWNVRWFPDGVPGPHSKPGTATDLEWLACSVARLDLDLVAVQEFKRHAGAERAIATLLAHLDRLTGGSWRLELDPCPPMHQHVGVLFDERRVTGMGLLTYEMLNPHGEACRDQLRPGFGGYFRFPGGLDLHLVSVHVKSGTERRSLTLRQASLDALVATRAAAHTLAPDSDLVIAGDLNTMGCSSCSPPIDAAAELTDLDARIAGAQLRRLRGPIPCSEYYRGHGGLLDHFLVDVAMAEAREATPHSDGLCGTTRCAPFGEAPPAAYERLSDHCPVVLELRDVDLD